MPNPDGGTQTGQSGNGYARIISPGGTDFAGGTQTGSFTILGNVDVADLNTASQAFNITIGQSGTSTIGSNTTFNNTGTLTLGSNAAGQSFAVTGTLTASAQSAINVAGAITSSGTQTYGALNIVNDTTLTSNSGAVSLGGEVNGAAALTVSSSSNFTLSNSVGSDTPLTALTIGTTSSTNNVTISATVNVNGAIAIFGNNITLNQDLTASSGNNVIISAIGDFDNNAGSDAINVSGAGRWIVYTANDNTTANFGSLNSNNAAIWASTYSTLAPASVASGNRYVFAETATQTITFTTTDETITYGDDLDLTDNYTLTTSGISALSGIYLGVSADDSVNLSTVYSSDPTISITASGSSNSTSGNIEAGSYTLVVSLTGGSVRSGYTIATSGTGTLTVHQKALTISGITAANKTYNGNTSATIDVSNAVYTGLVTDDDLSVSATGTFANKNVDTGIVVTLSSSYSGDDRDNYLITDQASTTADITAKTLTLTGLTANNKVYNGNTVATISSYGSLSGIETGDTVTLNSSSADPDFDDKNVDTSKTVTVQSLALAGTDAGNYSIGNQTTTADITAKTLTLTGLTANNKVYDGGTVATISSYGSLSGIETGDTVTLNSSSADPDFDDKNVDTSKTVTVQSLALAGTDAGNYSIGNQTTTANITAKSISSLTLSASNKTYDGNTTASVSVSSSDIVAGDTVTFSNSAVFNTRHVATGKTVTVSSVSISGGTDSGNYTLITTTGLTAANITQLASVTWNGNAGDGLWSSAGNWVGSALPDQNNVVAVVIPSDESVTFDSDIVGTIGSTIANSGTLTFNGSNNFTFGQVISGTGTLTKSESGTLTLSGINTYTGLTTINQGTLYITNAAGLGNASTGTTVSDGATLKVAGGLTVSEPITINGSGVSDVGAIYFESGNNTYSGAITLGSNATITSVAGNQIISGTISGAHALTITNSDLLTLQSSIGSEDTRLASLSVSGNVNLYSDIWTTGAQTYSGDVGVGSDIELNSSGNGITIVGAVSGISNETLLYETITPTRSGNNIVYVSGYGVGDSQAASTFVDDINTITYRMEVNVGGTLYYTEVTFDAWTGVTASDLRVPSLDDPIVIQKIVQNMKVSSNMTSDSVSAKSTGVTTGTGFTGYLELWPYNYSAARSNVLDPSVGSDSVFDYNDTHSNRDIYGSFQVHNITAGSTQTILAWNRHFDAAPDIGMGNYKGSANTDWTFAQTSGLGTSGFKLQILVNKNDYQNLNINAGSGVVNLSTSANLNQLNINSSSTSNRVSGAISGAGSVSYNGSANGLLNLAGNNSYTGATTISAGTLNITGTLGSGAYVGAIANSGTLEMASSSNQELAGIISGTGNIIKSGSGDLTLSAVNTYSGTTTISNGQLNIYAESGLGATPGYICC